MASSVAGERSMELIKYKFSQTTDEWNSGSTISGFPKRHICKALFYTNETGNCPWRKVKHSHCNKTITYAEHYVSMLGIIFSYGPHQELCDLIDQSKVSGYCRANQNHVFFQLILSDGRLLGLIASEDKCAFVGYLLLEPDAADTRPDVCSCFLSLDGHQVAITLRHSIRKPFSVDVSITNHDSLHLFETESEDRYGLLVYKRKASLSKIDNPCLGDLSVTLVKNRNNNAIYITPIALQDKEYYDLTVHSGCCMQKLSADNLKVECTSSVLPFPMSTNLPEIDWTLHNLLPSPDGSFIFICTENIGRDQMNRGIVHILKASNLERVQTLRFPLQTCYWWEQDYLGCFINVTPSFHFTGYMLSVWSGKLIPELQNTHQEYSSGVSSTPYHGFDCAAGNEKGFVHVFDLPPLECDLMMLCRKIILQSLQKKYHIEQLPLPIKLKKYLKFEF